MTRKRRQAWSDFWNDSQNISRHYLFFFFFWCDWVCSDKTAENFSSLICFFLFFVSSLAWLGMFGYKRVENFSSLFCFIFFFHSWHDWDNKRGENFSSRFWFSSFFFFLYLLYYAQDSCKKWQEKEGKLGLISGMTVEYFSSLFCFFFFFFFWCD